MPFSELFSRFVLAATLSTAFCVPMGLVFLRISGVPATYPPLLPQQVLAGTVSGSLLIALGYALLAALLPDRKTRFTVFIVLAAVLLVASFNLPYRLTYTQSARFAGVTLAGQMSQALLHCVVMLTGVICFLSEESGWS